MKVSQQILAFVLLLAVVIKEGLTLKCYSCNSFLHGNDCFNPGPNTPVVECEANQTLCRKVEQDLYYQGDDHNRVFRQCATEGSLGECLERTGTYRFKSWYCQCKGELCNGTEGLAMSVSLTVAAISAIFALRKLL